MRPKCKHSGNSDELWIFCAIGVCAVVHYIYDRNGSDREFCNHGFMVARHGIRKTPIPKIYKNINYQHHEMGRCRKIDCCYRLLSLSKFKKCQPMDDDKVRTRIVKKLHCYIHSLEQPPPHFPPACIEITNQTGLGSSICHIDRRKTQRETRNVTPVPLRWNPQKVQTDKKKCQMSLSKKIYL